MMLVEKYQNRLESKKAEAIQEMLRIETYLSSIEDIETRMIFNYRYIEKKKLGTNSYVDAYVNSYCISKA